MGNIEYGKNSHINLSSSGAPFHFADKNRKCLLKHNAVIIWNLMIYNWKSWNGAYSIQKHIFEIDSNQWQCTKTMRHVLSSSKIDDDTPSSLCSKLTSMSHWYHKISKINLVQCNFIMSFNCAPLEQFFHSTLISSIRDKIGSSRLKFKRVSWYQSIESNRMINIETKANSLCNNFRPVGYRNTKYPAISM